MKRNTTKLRSAITFVILLVIGTASIFIAQKLALTLFQMMHEMFTTYKWEFAISFLFIFLGVFLGLVRAFRSAAAVFKCNRSHHATKGK